MKVKVRNLVAKQACRNRAATHIDRKKEFKKRGTPNGHKSVLRCYES